MTFPPGYSEICLIYALINFETSYCKCKFFPVRKHVMFGPFYLFWLFKRFAIRLLRSIIVLQPLTELDNGLPPEYTSYILQRPHKRQTTPETGTVEDVPT